jgi:hypothetical protein
VNEHVPDTSFCGLAGTGAKPPLAAAMVDPCSVDPDFAVEVDMKKGKSLGYRPTASASEAAQGLMLA